MVLEYFRKLYLTNKLLTSQNIYNQLELFKIFIQCFKYRLTNFIKNEP